MVFFPKNQLFQESYPTHKKLLGMLSTRETTVYIQSTRKFTLRILLEEIRHLGIFPEARVFAIKKDSLQ